MPLERQLWNWHQDGRLSALDLQFGRFLARGSGSDDLGLLGAVTSRQRRLGHVCLDPGLPPDDLPGLDLERSWRAIQPLASPWLGRGPDDWSPLVLDRDRLYLGRLHRAECAIADRIRAWTRAPGLPPPDPRQVRRLFPTEGPGSEDQRLAAVVAAIRPFCLITGGPGTGKTTTVLRVLALHLLRRPDLGIRLLAPTGKAAARLSDALRQGKARLSLPGVDTGRIPDRVSTVHRFLGLGRGRPRYHRHRPAPLDLVVLDEASMVDLPTMYRLLDALPTTAGLILLGDPDQLASVEAGSVLADLVAPARARAFSPATRQALAAAGLEPPADEAPGGPLDDSLVRLEWSHRFSAAQGIGRLAAGVQDGSADWDGLLEIAGTSREIEVLSWQGERLPATALQGFLEWLDSRAHHRVEDALEGLQRVRVLCALRSGPAGVDGLNRTIAERLGQASERQVHGRPILITRNAHALGIYNGDMGLLWQETEAAPTGQARLRACFPAADGGVRRLPVAELPAHEPAYALTVHKSQGSEYDRVLLVLPPRPHPLVTRELVYTALTRARQEVRILAAPETWNAGIRRRTRRASGLAQRLT